MLTIVIPALDEEATIGATVDGVRESLDRERIEHEIIVVDDGSKDRTGAIAAERGARVIAHPSPGGYGRSLKDGIAAARHDLIGITDADGTYPVHRLPELYRLVQDKGFDMAVGARTGPAYRGTFLKTPARKVFHWLTEYATGQKIADINSGLRVFRKGFVEQHSHTISSGFSFTTTITLAALLNGYFVKYIPVEYYERTGDSHIRYFRDSLRSLQIIVESILYYNPFKLFLLLSSALMLVAATAVVGYVLVDSTPAQIVLAILGSTCFTGAFVVAAVGLAADLNRSVSRRKD
jgi:glycosyltransferase involved in cell wall biosynthesis